MIFFFPLRPGFDFGEKIEGKKNYYDNFSNNRGYQTKKNYRTINPSSKHIGSGVLYLVKKQKPN